MGSEQLNQEHIIWTADVAERYGKTRNTVIRWINDGTIARPDIVINGRAGWYESTISTWERSTAQHHRNYANEASVA